MVILSITGIRIRDADSHCVLAQAGPRGPAQVHAIEATRLDKIQAGCKAVSMDFYVPGAHGPPYNFSFMDPPFSPFQMVSIGYYGPYVMCPFMVPIVN